jgi:HPt (histidine-containing phosphotransfer) domain-containing protein
MNDDVVDLKEVLERVQDDQELLLELFDIFMGDFKEKRITIDKEIADKNFEKLKNLAHSLKGASSNISAKKIYASFSELERIATDGDRAKIDDLLKKIDQQFGSLESTVIKIKKEFKKF